MPADPIMAEAVLAYMTEAAPVLALTLDAQQRVRAANSHARRLLGEVVVGRPLSDLVVEFTPLPDLRVSSATGHLLSLKMAAGWPESFWFRFYALPEGTLALGSLDHQEQARLRVDASKLEQVLLNLIGNAVEHSVAGQRVWLSSHWEEQNLVFEVRDEGPGITSEDKARLFTSFARAGTRKTAGERSVGLGLAIARLVVEAHGGHIGVDSVPGQGATFRFSLPLQSPTTKNQG